jgi:hypothetical protein
MTGFCKFEGRYPGGNLTPFVGRDLRGSLHREGDVVILRLESVRDLEFWIEARAHLKDVLGELLTAERPGTERCTSPAT